MTIYNPREIEKEISAYWERLEIPARVTEFDPEKKKFYLLDGPPYINYDPHVGHLKTTTLKDIWGKFKQMNGFSSWWQPGFDCSGLPIENAVEKKLGIKSKRDIETLGVSKFIQECRQLAEKNKPVWMDIYRKLGAWRGWVEPYLTYKNYYLESGWWSVKKMFEKGLLVEGEKSGFWCSHCETVLAGYEVTDSYKNVQDPSVFIKFPLQTTKTGKDDKEFLLVWTTTPWTLTSNVCIAVNPKETYVKVVTESGNLILAKKRLSILNEIGVFGKVVEEFSGAELDGKKYLGVLDTPLQKEMDEKFHYVIMSIPLLKKRSTSKTGSGEEIFEDFVTMDSGTGLVHTAPGLGDSKVGEHYNLPSLSPINDQGCFTEGAGKYQGSYVKKADRMILDDLKEKGLLLHEGKITHSYPLCWRCKTPLIYRMSKQWFLKIDTLREKMLKENKEVNWLPGFARERFQEILSTAPDWAVTRQRYWGIPMPVWVCQSCKSRKVIGSVEELERESGVSPRDLHKDVVDQIFLKCKGVPGEGCGGKMERVKDIMDVWFDSGISPWASLGYPFKNKELFEKLWPVDLVDESQDQVRGWFYTLMVSGHAVFGRRPYDTVCLNGWVLDEKGEKMSKSVGNVVSAQDAMDELGSDLLRLYYCHDLPPWETQRFSFKSARELSRVLNVLWNSFIFAKTYGSQAGEAPELKPEDRWILSRLNSLSEGMEKNIESFHFHLAGRALVSFILDDFSRWYIKIIRDRVSPFYSGPDKRAAQYTMGLVLETVVKLMAPITPFISEKIFLEMEKTRKDSSSDVLIGGAARGLSSDVLIGGVAKSPTSNVSIRNLVRSVHLQSWPSSKSERIDKELEGRMESVMALVEGLNAERQEKKIKLRWPIDKVFVQSEVNMKDLEEVIKVMGNIKEVAFVGKLTVKGREFTAVPSSDASIRKEVKGSFSIGKVLKDEALVRELVRKIQEMRKNAGLQVHDKIKLSLESDKSSQMILNRFEKEIREGTGSSKITLGPVKNKKGFLDFEGKKVEIGF